MKKQKNVYEALQKCLGMVTVLEFNYKREIMIIVTHNLRTRKQIFLGKDKTVIT